jgi:hypothetical protein
MVLFTVTTLGNVKVYERILIAIFLKLFLRRNSFLKHVIEGKIERRMEMTGRRGRRCMQLLDDLKEKRRYWKLKEEALDSTLWRFWRLWKRLRTCRRADYRMNE